MGTAPQGKGIAMQPLTLGGVLVLLVVMGTTSQLEEVSPVQDGGAGDVLLSVAEGVGGIDIDVNKKDMKDAPRKKLGYANIPGFVFKHMGQENDANTVADCEELCDKEDTCRSYSYNQKDKICVWSIETIRIRPGWEFWTKVHELDAFGKFRHYGKYRNFPDIMYQEPGYKKFKDVSVKNCQKHCNEDEKCKAFSYQKKKTRCYLADSGIHYDPDYQYYQRRGMKPRKNAMDMEDLQTQLQKDEKVAKIAKRKRLVASISEREDKNAKTADEMRQKGNRRETKVKKNEKIHAENRLHREKINEAHDKRLARMKTVYNEGYFKAKGIAAEKKVKEKDIKKLRAKEQDDKDKRKEQMHKQKNRKQREEKEAKEQRHKAEQRMLTAKEKLTKLKNADMQLEVHKEERILDVAKNLALEKASQHAEVQENEKEDKFNKVMAQKRGIHKFKTQEKKYKLEHEHGDKLLKTLKLMTEKKNWKSEHMDPKNFQLDTSYNATGASMPTMPKRALGESDQGSDSELTPDAYDRLPSGVSVPEPESVTAEAVKDMSP